MDDSCATVRRAAGLHAALLLIALVLTAPPLLGQTLPPSAAPAEKGTGAETAAPEKSTAETSSAETAAEGDAEPSGAGAPQESNAAPEGNAAQEDSLVSDEEDLSDLDSAAREPAREAEPALTDAPADAYLEDEDDWLKWPFSKRNQNDPAQKEPHRWGGAGGFVGWVNRPSQSDSIKYRPGIAWGGYVRAELVSWLGLRLFYREERIPVQVERGAFDYDGDVYDDDFEQPDMEMLNLGARFEPTLVVHPRFRVRGIVGWSWLWFRAPYPKSEDFELKRTFRSAVQMDFSFGAGLSLDIVENWIDISLDSAYSVPAGRTGTAYEPAQIVRDGGIKHIAPMPMLQNSIDCLISLGVIL